MEKAISIMAFPRNGNAYSECFYDALEAAGVVVQGGVFAGRWLLDNLRDRDYVHINWPSLLYSETRPGRCLYSFGIFLLLLAIARARRIRIIWTIHNLYPHDRCVIPFLDKLARWLLVTMAARFLIHGRAAEKEVLRVFPKVAGRTILIEHGNWRSYYPCSIDRTDARATLGLSDTDFVVLFVGLCKPYKGLLSLISAVEELPGNPVLIIAGRFEDPEYEAVVRCGVDASPARIVLRSGFVADDYLQVYLRACNVVAIPYLETLTSGTAMLALSFGRPVVAPASGQLLDLIAEGCGVLYRSADPSGLRNALLSAMTMKFDESRILTHADAHDWSKTARVVVDNLRS